MSARTVFTKQTSKRLKNRRISVYLGTQEGQPVVHIRCDSLIRDYLGRRMRATTTLTLSMEAAQAIAQMIDDIPADFP